MLRFLTILLAICFGTQLVYSQTENIRPPAIGISFILNDFVTPQRIRSTSLSKVLATNNWAKFGEIGTGLAVHYFQGLRDKIDFAGTLTGSFIKTSSPEKPEADDNFLLEGDASANFKLFSDHYWVTPYMSVGVGASLLKKGFGAFVPLGGGIKINLFDEAAIFISSQYRVPVTTQTNCYHFMHSLGIAGVIGNKKNEPTVETF